MSSWLDPDAGLAALFVSSFLAATLLPGGSEAVLFAVLKAHPSLLMPALMLATLGNTLGGMSSWLIGRLLPQAPAGRALRIAHRWGSPGLLLAWVPIIGDALCVAAGWLRINWAAAAGFMAIGKLMRYWLVAQAAL